MNPAREISVDHDLHDVLVDLVHEHGAHDMAWLARRARLIRGDAGISKASVERVTDCATLLVVRPDGRVAHLGQVLDGIVLTQRVRGSLHGRQDLWVGNGVQPFLAMAAMRPLPLAAGGVVHAADSAEPVLLGPPGWLPEAERGDLIGLRWHEGCLDVERIDPTHLVEPSDQQYVRTLLGERCNRERWWKDDDPDLRAGLIVRSLGLARLEDPDLLSRPHPPLDEMLYDPLEVQARDHWRNVAATRQLDTVSFGIEGMPVALAMELRRRAEQYAMTTDQFLIAILGHLAWRTPFAEDIEPWEQWVPEWRPHPKLILTRAALPGRGDTAAPDTPTAS